MKAKSLTQILNAQPRRIDVSADMSDSFFADREIKIGKVLGFLKDGVTKRYKIVRLNRKSKKCEVIEVHLYKEDEVDIVDAK
jgi:hypothetical protein